MSNVVAFPKTSAPERWITKRQLAHRWVCSTKTIERLVREGMPSKDPADSPSGRRLFRLSECEAWYAERSGS